MPRPEPDRLAGLSERILRELVAMNSVNPYVAGGAGEGEIAEHIGTKLRSLGLRVQMQDVIDGRQNVIGFLKGRGRAGRTLMLNGHLDTVGVEGTVGDPFRPRVDSDRNLHGRGACDMKGSLSAMIAAIEWIVNQGEPLLGDVVFTGVVDEEYRGRGTLKVAETLRADGAIVGEPTGLEIATAHKGFVWLKVVTQGRAVHGSVPEKGVDAIEKMGELILGMRALRDRHHHRAIRHPLLGTPKIHTSTIAGGTEWAVIPEKCELGIERRTLPGEDESTAVEEIVSLVRDLEKRDPDFHASVSVDTVLPPFEEQSEAEIVKSLKTAMRKRSRGKASRTTIGVPYWTDAATLKNRAGIPTCLFGPGDIRLAHSRDEYISLDEVGMAARIFSEAMIHFCLVGN